MWIISQWGYYYYFFNQQGQLLKVKSPGPTQTEWIRLLEQGLGICVCKFPGKFTGLRVEPWSLFSSHCYCQSATDPLSFALSFVRQPFTLLCLFALVFQSISEIWWRHCQDTARCSCPSSPGVNAPRRSFTDPPYTGRRQQQGLFSL